MVYHEKVTRLMSLNSIQKQALPEEKWEEIRNNFKRLIKMTRDDF